MNTTPSTTGTLGGINTFHLRVIEARGLHFIGGIQEANPYIEVKLKGLRHLLSSEKQEGGALSRDLFWNQSNPVWNSDFVLHPTSVNDVVQVRVWDKRLIGNTYLGKALIPVSTYLNRGIQDSWFPLFGKRGTSASGEVRLWINYGASSTSFGQSGYGGQNQQRLGNQQTPYGTNYYPSQAVQHSQQQMYPGQQSLGQQQFPSAVTQHGTFAHQPGGYGQQGGFGQGFGQQQGGFGQQGFNQGQSGPSVIKEVTTTTERVFGNQASSQLPNQRYTPQ